MTPQIITFIVIILAIVYMFQKNKETFSPGTLVDLQSSTPYMYGPVCGNMPFYRHPMFFHKHPYYFMRPPYPGGYPMWGRTRELYF